jgi:hypothetical protein
MGLEAVHRCATPWWGAEVCRLIDRLWHRPIRHPNMQLALKLNFGENVAEHHVMQCALRNPYSPHSMRQIIFTSHAIPLYQRHMDHNVFFHRLAHFPKYSQYFLVQS